MQELEGLPVLLAERTVLHVLVQHTELVLHVLREQLQMLQVLPGLGLVAHLVGLIHLVGVGRQAVLAVLLGGVGGTHSHVRRHVLRGGDLSVGDGLSRVVALRLQETADSLQMALLSQAQIQLPRVLCLLNQLDPLFRNLVRAQ